LSNQKFINFSSPQFKQRAQLIIPWLAIAVGLIMVRSVVLPFVLAALLAYVFHPIVGFLGKIKFKSKPLPRAVSVIIIYLFFIGIIALLCAFFLPQFYMEMVRLVKDATTFINSMDQNTIISFGQKMEDFFRAYDLPLEIVVPPTDSIRPQAAPHKTHWISIDLLDISQNLLNDALIYLKSEARNIISSAQTIFIQFISSLFMILLILMITGFLLVDVERIKNFVFSLVPVSDRSAFNDFLKRLDKRLAGVVRGQLTICVVNAVLTLIGLLIFDIKFAFILATIAGIFSLVPIFGSIISTIPIVLVALTMSPLKGLIALAWIAGIHILEANFLNPKIMGNSAQIHPVLILLALLFGERFYGIVGALLAVPIMSVILTIFASMLGRARLMNGGVANPVESDTIPTKEV